MGLGNLEPDQAESSNTFTIRDRGMVTNYHVRTQDVETFVEDQTVVDLANIKQDRTLRSKISPKETNFIKSKTGFFAKSAHVECQENQRAIIFRLGRIRMDQDHPDGIYGPGRVKYYPEIDSTPILIPKYDDEKLLPEQELITGDMKQIRVRASYIYRILDPIKYYLNVRDALEATEQLMSALLRDVVGYHTYEVVKTDKKRFEEQLKIELGRVTLGWGIRVEKISFKNLDLINQLKYSFVIVPPKPYIPATTTTTTTTTTASAGAAAAASTTTTTTTTTTASGRSSVEPDSYNISF